MRYLSVHCHAGWSDPTINSYKNNSLKGTIQLVAKGETIVTTPVETTTETPGTSETPGTTTGYHCGAGHHKSTR